MKFFFDENLPPRLAHALAILEEGFKPVDAEVKHLVDEFDRGTQDEVWLPWAGDHGYTVISRDLNIRRTRSQWQICQDHGVGIFFFKTPSKTGWSYWEWVLRVFRRWEEIKRLNQATPKPFGFQVLPRSINPM